jgi:hypothetical protein
MAEKLTGNINIKIEPSVREALQRVADIVFPSVPGNMSVLARKYIKEAIEAHDQQAKRSRK